MAEVCNDMMTGWSFVWWNSKAGLLSSSRIHWESIESAEYSSGVETGPGSRDDSIRSVSLIVIHYRLERVRS